MSLIIHFTIEELKTVAFVTVLIVLFAIALDAHPFRRKREFMSHKLWDASEYYIYLKHCIAKCVTGAHLNDVRPLVNKFQKYYRKVTDQEELQRYYSRLQEAINEKEKELNGQLQAV